MTEDTFYADLMVLSDKIKWLKGENERLQIENGLLRKASEEQRELNGALRVELQQLTNGGSHDNRTLDELYS